MQARMLIPSTRGLTLSSNPGAMVRPAMANLPQEDLGAGLTGEQFGWDPDHDNLEYDLCRYLWLL